MSIQMKMTKGSNYLNIDKAQNQSDQLWSITNMNFEHNSQEKESTNYPKNVNQINCDISFNRDDAKMENSFNFKNSTKQTNKLHSFYSIVERLRNFLYINLLLNKYTVIFSLLGYLSDLFLFVSLNLYIFSNKHFLYEFKSTENETNLNRSFLDNNSYILKSNVSDFVKKKSTRTIKQSYLTLQILVVFVFFICFILSYLIKFQFKYHRWALSLYDYDIETTNEQEKDTVDRESLTSTTTASHFSSSNGKKLYSVFKKILNRLFTKLASIILNFLFGYQFCQNCFIEQPNQIAKDSYSLFIHFFIFACVLSRCTIGLLKKKYAINFGKNLKKLQEKALYDSKCNLNKNYYFNYYSYLMKYNQDQCNQLKQHQNNKNNFRIFQLDDMSLFLGFILSLFHLFYALKSIELTFVFAPLLLTLILFRLKSSLNASFNLSIFFLSLLFISKMNTYTITDIGEFIRLNSSSTDTSSTNTSFFDLLILNDQQISQHPSSSIITLLSYNILTFSAFLLTLYFKSIVNIYYCTLNSLERWNISFLCQMSFWHKLVIYLSCFFYFLFSITCSITLLIRFKSWSFLIFPIYLFFAVLWCSFQILSMINLTHLMNKIADCYLLLNETKSLSNTNSFENSSNLSRKTALNQLAINRDSILTQSTSSNNNSNQNNNSNKNKFCLRIRKYLIRILKYKNLTNKSYSNINVPIHRILSYKSVRHLGSISYRLALYCFIQTVLLGLFVFSTNSPLTIGLYLTTLSINFIWLSLLYLFPKSSTGTCIAFALVAPPLILNIYNAGTLSTTLSCASNSVLINDTKKSKTNSNTATNSSNSNSAIKPNTFMSLPFNYQQALTQRCTYILNRIQAFLQFHLIENYGCDFVSTGLSKESLEQKLRVYFEKCSNDGSYYNTYILYYCGPTSILTDSFTFIDGDELSIEQVIKIWKDIHCNNDPTADLSTEPNNQHEANNNVPNSKLHKNSRLILILDAENTNKSLHYVKTKLNEPNVYVALQTVKYNYNFHKFNLSKSAKNSETKLILKNRKKIKTMSPGSPQSIPGSYFDSYLNIGKFTLDWIKSNCSAANLTSQDSENLNRLEYFLNNNQNFDETIRINDEKESDENDEDEEYDDDDDDEDYNQDEDNDDEYDSVEFNENKKNNNKSNVRNTSDPFFYEAKCAFSKYWTSYTYDSSDTSLASDLNHFWNLYYPYIFCRPMLKLINCRIFYLKIDFFKKIFYLFKKLKEKIIPVHEYDTGHGFKLFTS